CVFCGARPVCSPQWRKRGLGTCLPAPCCGLPGRSCGCQERARSETSTPRRNSRSWVTSNWVTKPGWATLDVNDVELGKTELASSAWPGKEDNERRISPYPP